MKRTLLFVIGAQVVVSLAHPMGKDHYLEAIARFETNAGHDADYGWKPQPADKKVGKHGEITRYQILPINLNEEERETRPRPTNENYPAWSRCVAERILTERLTRFWQLYHRTPTDREVYILWNAPTYLLYKKRWRHRYPIPAVVEERAKRFAATLKGK